ncbi:MAG: hypothetical protein AAF740_00480 [Bacteroidota bacterium]
MNTQIPSLPPFVSGCLPEHYTLPNPDSSFPLLNTLDLPEGMNWAKLHDLRNHSNFTYGVASLSIKSQTLEYVIHKHFPLLAPAKVSWRNKTPIAAEFTEWTPESDFLRKSFILLEPDWLLLKPEPDFPECKALLRDLDFWEFGQFSYFRPENVGEIIFNNWDKKRSRF